MKNCCTVGKDWKRRVLLLIGCIFSLVLQLRTLVSFRQHTINAASATSSNLLQPQDNGPVDPQARLIRTATAQSHVDHQAFDAAGNLSSSSDQKTPSLTAANSSSVELSQSTVADKKASSSEASSQAASSSSSAAAAAAAATRRSSDQKTPSLTAANSSAVELSQTTVADKKAPSSEASSQAASSSSSVAAAAAAAAAATRRSSDQKTPSLTAANSSRVEMSQTTMADKKASSSEASSQAASSSSSTAAATATPAADSTDSSKHHLDWSRVKEMDRPKETFQRYDQVAVVTKVAGPLELGKLKQMVCLFTAAYNRHVNYDIIVFTTLPWEPHQIQELQAVVPDTTKLVVELEGPPLAERVAQLDPAERELLHRRCKVNVKDGGVLSWNHYCSEEPNVTKAREHLTVKLSYAWQAEFRAYLLWNAPILQSYKYMMWIDSDAYATKPWSKDPMKLFIENDLALCFDHRAGDFFDNRELLNLTLKAYNRTLCRVSLKDGHLDPVPCNGLDDWYVIALVHGFFHITNLDFYRSERSSRFLKSLVGKQKFSREWDDQIAVTIPAVMDAPERSWDMRSHGLHMGVLHNGNMDGQRNELPVKDEQYTTYWNEKVKREWNAASEMCNELVRHGG